MTELEKDLSDSVEENIRSLSQPLKPPPMPPFEPVPLRAKQVTLADQMSQLEKAETHILDKLRRESLDARATADRKISDAQTDFERQLSEETIRLERQRDSIIHQAREDYHSRLHELTALLRRRS